MSNSEDLEKVKRWLAHIGETDQQHINEVLAVCIDPEGLAYYLKRAEEVPREGLAKTEGVA